MDQVAIAPPLAPIRVARMKPALRPIWCISQAAGMLVSMTITKPAAKGRVASDLSSARPAPTSAEAVIMSEELLIIIACAKERMGILR